jgi:hypothetical protein
MATHPALGWQQPTLNKPGAGADDEHITVGFLAISANLDPSWRTFPHRHFALPSSPTAPTTSCALTLSRLIISGQSGKSSRG